MKIVQGTSRQQMQFISLDDLITADNPVRIIDAFVEKLDLPKLGIDQHNAGNLQTKTKAGGAPRFDNKVLLKLYLYGYLNRVSGCLFAIFFSFIPKSKLNSLYSN